MPIQLRLFPSNSTQCWMSVVPPTGLLDSLIGALLIGVIVSSVVYGITCLQVYLYYTEHSSRDSTALKTFVAILITLDTLHVALISHTIYYESVTIFGNTVALQDSPWSLVIQVPVANIIASCVQLVFAARVHHLSKGINWWAPGAICVSSLGQLIGAFGVCIVELQTHGHPDFDTLDRWAIASTSNSIVCDVIITVAMIYYLNHSRTQFARTNRAINKLITYTLNTGLLTTLFTVVEFILFVMHIQTYVYTPFSFLLARLYLCSFMSTLNSRGSVRAAIEDNSERFVTLSHLRSQTAGTPTNNLSGDVLQFKRGSLEQEDFVQGGSGLQMG